MSGGELVREARKRAGLSQRELAERFGTTQAVIARWESGQTSPSFERVVQAIRACGLELSVRITKPDHDHALLIEENLRLSPQQRLERLITSRSAIEELVAKVRRSDQPSSQRSPAERLEERLRRGRVNEV
ncbi:MAG: helix-turn-helix transcriptional regulator [Actinobacteria bacterium]|nr:helix-turn-helix transcriptional regulator [Actinomycetota bacterium]